MSRIQTEVISVRLTPQLAQLISIYAKKNGMKNPDGSPNLSTAARTLLAVGLDRGDGAVISKAAYDSARSAILQSVQARLKGVMASLTKEIGEGRI